jgi:pseudaminic acid cytidylyltransferase
MIVAVIPARSGSKRIKDKNIRNFLGLPMLVRTINLLNKSKLFDRIFVSTNDLNYAKMAIDAGAIVDHLRPSELSSDFIGLREVMKFELSEYGFKDDSKIETLCVLPCTPLLNKAILQDALETFSPNSFDQLFPVTKNSNQSQRSFRIDSNGHLIPLVYENKFLRTQDLEDTFQDAGQFYLSTSGNWISGKLDEIQAMVVPKTIAVDIDEEEDWVLAEALFKHQNS